jgi:hypothetical protein
MIIKKWSGSVWENQAPKTTAAQLFTDNTFGTSIFDGNTKLKVNYLPDSVFDSLFFQGTTTGNVGAAGAREALANTLHTARLNSVSLNRSFVGSYFVISAGGTISAVTGIQTTIPTGFYYTLTFSNTDGTATSSTSSGVLEVGDWFVVNSITGAGTLGTPFVITAAVISNTYEVASATVHGIVKLGSDTSNTATAAAVTNTADRTYLTQNNASGQLVVNVPWVDNNTLDTAGSTDISTKIFLIGASTQTGNSVTRSDDQVFATNGTLTASRIESTVANGTAPFITASATVVPNLNANYLQGNTAADFADAVHTHVLANITDVTATVTELNYIDGVTSSIQTQLDGKATTTHGHGDISNAGTIVSTVVAPGNGDHIIISDANAATANTLKRSIAIGTSTTTFLNNSGAWTTPAGTQYTAGDGIGLSGTSFSVAAGEGLTQLSSGLRMTFPLYVQTATPTTTVTNAIWYDIN